MSSTGSGNQPIQSNTVMNTSSHSSLNNSTEPVNISTSNPTHFSDPFSRSPVQNGSSSFSKSPTSPISARRSSIGAGYIKSPPLIPPLPENQSMSTDGLDGDSRRGSEAVVDGDDDGEIVPLSQRDRRMSREWDASQTPPSRFQKLPGSIWATPASRDGRIARNKIYGFKEKAKGTTGASKNKYDDDK